MKNKRLGKDGPAVGRLGYGAMVLEGYYGASEDETAVDTLCHAIDSGMMIDSADAYGNGHNEELLAQAIRQSNADPFIATKFGIVFDDAWDGSDLPTGWGFSLKINGTPEYARHALDQSLRRLGVETIDLWYAHYLDPNVPVEDTVGAMSDAVRDGKVRHLGLSNVTAEEIKRAHAVHPISAVQYEYSLWRREAETEILPTLRDLGIALVAWSPLGSGFLTGTVEKLAEGDFRNNNPRFSGDNFGSNQDRFAPLNELAQKLGITTAQLALAWLLHQGDDVFAIPGTRKVARIDENNQAADVVLSADDLQTIEEIAAPGVASGATLV